TIKNPMIDARKRVVGTAGIARDVTEKRRVLERLRAGELAMRQALGIRDALARDLHDSTIQSLYAIGLGLEDCRHVLPPGSQEADRRLRGSIEQLNAMIRDLRSFISEVRSGDAVEGAGSLAGELRELAKHIRATQSIHLTCRVDEQACKAIGLYHANHVLAVVKEAVSNTLRHARAKKLSITVRRVRKTVVIRVKDDGMGLKREGRHRGYGLKNIYSRAADMSGRLKISSTPGKGTLVRVEVDRE
ncbi:MAG: ATP-binding protein, partial [Lentisphaerota bacterium]